MKIGVFSFTTNGYKLETKLKNILVSSAFRGEKIEVILYSSMGEDGTSSLKENVKKAFHSCQALIFVSASGIAVRLIAPYINDKLSDPAVIVIDEKATFVIPVLSGHVGGANELSRILANKLGAVCAVTTATDVNNVFSIDEFAACNGLSILNKDTIKAVNKKILEGDSLEIGVDDRIEIAGDVKNLDNNIKIRRLCFRSETGLNINSKESFDAIISCGEIELQDDTTTLIMRLKPLVIGIGCRKNKSKEDIEGFILEALRSLNKKTTDVALLSTIDIKQDEAGIVEFSKKYEIPIKTYSAEYLNGIEGDFEESDFVLKTVGVSDVSARAAKACGKEGDFLIKKSKENGITLSVFEKKMKVEFDYEKS